MSKQENSTIILSENMQESLDKKDKTIQELLAQNNTLKEHIKLLDQKIDYLTRQLFVKKSEKLPDNQLSLFADLENKEVKEDKQEEIKIEYTRAKGGKRRPSKHLPRVRVEHDISDEEEICSCGCQREVIKEVKSEQYDVIPATFQVVENVRFFGTIKLTV